jgi:hypothetical protein
VAFIIQSALSCKVGWAPFNSEVVKIFPGNGGYVLLVDNRICTEYKVQLSGQGWNGLHKI